MTTTIESLKKKKYTIQIDKEGIARVIRVKIYDEFGKLKTSSGLSARNLLSCGVSEVDGTGYCLSALSKYLTQDQIVKILKSWLDPLVEKEKAFIIFSPISIKRYTHKASEKRTFVINTLDKLCKGKTRTPSKVNPNHGGNNDYNNDLKIYIYYKD